MRKIYTTNGTSKYYRWTIPKTDKKKEKQKTPGNNNLTAEMYKAVAKNENRLRKITQAMNNTIKKK